MKRLRFASTVSLLALVSVSAAQNYPAKSVQFILPYAAGANPDVVARTIAQKLSESWGKPVIVENRAAGSGGVIGMQAVLAAPPDGYTLMLGAPGSMTIAPSLYKLPYDTRKDFDAITMLAYVPNVLVVNSSLPVRNVKELIALAKSQPGKLDYASASSGSISHLAGEVFNWRAGVKLTHIPYRGSPAAMTALLSGEVALMYSAVPLALPHIRNGRLRALGVTTAKRSATMPELPTIAEAGLKGYEATQWYALFARAGTPREIVNKINSDVVKILGIPEIRAKLASEGTDPVTTTPEELAALIKTEIPQWAPIVKTSGARAD
jgi:tripartite-type tricarboxylate transporter receptor subunit TctC